MAGDVVHLDPIAAVFSATGALARPMVLVQSFVGKHRRAPREVIVARFWANLTKSDGCWTWTGPVSAYGYGMIRTGGRGAYVYAHRFSYELHRGAIPADMFVCHTCDVRACVNPAHLFLGTHKDNRLDMIAKGRNARGERAGGVKLAESGAAEVIAALARRESVTEIARRHGITRGAVYGILRGENWKHLPRPAGLPQPCSRKERVARAA